ncbi:hypothetical protein ACOZZR_003386 [Cronobacter sakazakii]
MATQPTNNPVPSESPRDLKFNAGKIDEFVTSLVNTYVDRFGNEHYTIEGLRWLAQQAIAQYGWIPVGTFQAGTTLTLPNQVLKDMTDGEYYRWDGALPKVVPAGSTPASTGGTGVGAWISVGDSALRSALASSDGLSLIGELISVADFSKITPTDKKKVRLRGWYAVSTVGAGDFYYDSASPKSLHDGAIYISPTVPYANAIDFINGAGESDPSGTGCWVRSNVTEIQFSWWAPQFLEHHSSALQKALDKAKLLRLDIYLPPGEFILRSKVTYDYSSGVTSSSPRGGNIIGSGSKRTVIIQDVQSGGFPSNGVALQITGSLGTSDYQIDRFTLKGMSIRGNGTVASGNNNTGTFLIMERMVGFTIEDIFSNNLYRSLIIQDSLYGSVRDCRITSSVEGLLMRKLNSVTGVNVVTFERVDFIDCWHLCLQAVESQQVVIDNCSFEANGNRDTAGTACIIARRIGSAGGVGVDIRNCYFENNNMRDVAIAYDINLPCQASIRNCNFAKTSSNAYSGRIGVTGSVTPTGTAYCKLTMTDNQFLVGGDYVDDPVNRPDVFFSGFSFTNTGPDKVKFIDENNVITAGVVVTSAVNYIKSRGDLFTARVAADGTLSAAGSANVVSVSKTGTGLYTLTSNVNLDKAVFLTMFHNGNGGGIQVTSTNNVASVIVKNSSGVNSDIAFTVKAVLL